MARSRCRGAGSGGKGTPAYEALAYVPHFDKGIPSSWVSASDVAYYNGRARGLHGNPIGTEYEEGHFPHEAYDPADPPVFESEASSLERHALLLAQEERRIPAEGWEPVAAGGAPVVHLPTTG